MKNIFKTQYRIVTDNYAGYEAQVRYWWFPIWTQLNIINTSFSIESSKRLIDKHKYDHEFKRKVVWKDGVDI